MLVIGFLKLRCDAKTILLELKKFEGTESMSSLNINIKRVLITMFFLTFVVTLNDAFAYIDPGSSSVLWQMLAAAFIGVILQIKKIILFVRSKFRKKG